MKALTLTQPWATFVAIGVKRIETRSWSTRYRGPLAIHAAKAMPAEARTLCEEEPLRTLLEQAGFGGADDLPRGVVIAVADLVSVALMSTQMLTRGPFGWWWIGPNRRQYAFPFTEQERMLGNFAHGRYGWLLDTVELLDKPVQAKGALGLWEWDAPQHFIDRKVSI